MMPINRARKALVAPIPAPVGGLNTVAPLAAMPPGDASVMTNLFPKAASVDTRPGFVSQTTVVYPGSGTVTDRIPGFVKYGDTSLWAYASINGGSAMFKDVVAGTTQVVGITTTALTTPSYTQFANAAGVYVATILISGDAYNYWTYNGSAWTNQTASLTNGSDYTGIAAFANRLWFRKGNGLDVYYLPTSAITGTPIAFPLGAVATKGGTIAAFGTWATDGGDGGGDDRLVFVTSNGQVIVYAGTDPSALATFALVGVYDCSKPISSQTLKYGADLLLPMEDGLFSTAELLRGRAEAEFAISSKVRSEWQRLGKLGFNALTLTYSSKLNQLVVNFPSSTFAIGGPIVSEQLVMNTITKVWTRYTGMSAYGIDTLAGNIYFSNVTTTGVVYKVDGTALDDNGTAITWECRQAYNYLDSPGNKQPTLMQPVMNWTGNFSMTAEIDADFNAGTISAYTSYTVAAQANVEPWLTANKHGRALAVHLKGQTSVGVGVWYATNIAFKPLMGIAK